MDIVSTFYQLYLIFFGVRGVKDLAGKKKQNLAARVGDVLRMIGSLLQNPLDSTFEMDQVRCVSPPILIEQRLCMVKKVMLQPLLIVEGTLPPLYYLWTLKILKHA
jgi:hypothetical protein